MPSTKLIVGLQVYNEADKFLPEWVKEVRSYADDLVVLDDCSTDDTVRVLFEGFTGKPLNVSRAPENLFTKNELVLRKWLWSLLRETARRYLEQGHIPWILMLDADEFMEDKFKREFRPLLEDPGMWHYGLQFYHFWRSRDYYRVDKLWKPPTGPRLIRIDPDFPGKWRETPLHCGSTPSNIFNREGRPGRNLDYVIKHYGYVLSPEEKHARYTALDPKGAFAPQKHYDSILDTNPVLMKWRERE